MISQGRFAGRRAVVTGGASGIGRAVAERLTAEGARVAIWDRDAAGGGGGGGGHRRDPGAARHHRLARGRGGGGARPREAFGGIDVLVCSAGITGATVPVADFPVAGFREVFAINVFGLFHCNKAVVPVMQAGGYGRIVNIASIAGKEGNPNASAYSASKAAVIGFTKSLGKELATARASSSTPSRRRRCGRRSSTRCRRATSTSCCRRSPWAASAPWTRSPAW